MLTSGVCWSAGVYTRRIEKDEFLLRVIDCPNLISADTLDTGALDDLTKLPATGRIDVVLYVDRLDVFRVQPADRQVSPADSVIRHGRLHLSPHAKSGKSRSCDGARGAARLPCLA